MEALVIAKLPDGGYLIGHTQDWTNQQSSVRPMWAVKTIEEVADYVREKGPELYVHTVRGDLQRKA